MRTGKGGKKRRDSEGAQAGEAKCSPVPVRLSLLGRRAGLRLAMADEHPVRFTL
jgi:hypothetical protein